MIPVMKRFLGQQSLYRFENGYGASVIPDVSGGLELAVIKYNDSLYMGCFELCYDTPITDDVCRHLDEVTVNELLIQIKSLPAKEST